MPCFLNYNPKPPRVWSRLQNKCSINKENSSTFVDKKQEQMNLKGNILQYKNNSSNITKKQKYSQIAKGSWTNRTKNYASQTQKYTNPNTNSLLRVNYNVIDLPKNINDPFYCSKSNSVEDGGNLIGTITVNPCTKQVINVTKNINCFPTTFSDVPGTSQILCWNPKIATWFPRQRYIMPACGSKWPVNYKFFVSALQPTN